MSALLPLYHPTTCLAVDDDRLYLDSFCYNYADVTLCATEYRPEHAIERLLKDAGRTGLAIEDANLPPAGDSALTILSCACRHRASPRWPAIRLALRGFP